MGIGADNDTVAYKLQTLVKTGHYCDRIGFCGLQKTYHWGGNLIVVADNAGAVFVDIRKKSLDFLQEKRLGFCGEPDNVIVPYLPTQLNQRVHISGIPQKALHIVTLEDAADMPVPGTDHFRGSPITTSIVICYNVDHIISCDIRIIAVDENNGNTPPCQTVIKLSVRVWQGSFCPFHDDSIDRVFQQTGENQTLRGNTVVG